MAGLQWSFSFPHVAKLSKNLLSSSAKHTLDATLASIVNSIEAFIQIDNHDREGDDIEVLLVQFRMQLDIYGAFLLQHDDFVWSPLWKALHDFGFYFAELLNAIEGRHRSTDAAATFNITTYCLMIRLWNLDVKLKVKPKAWKETPPFDIDRCLLTKAEEKDDFCMNGLKIKFWTETRMQRWRGDVQAGGDPEWAAEMFDVPSTR